MKQALCLWAMIVLSAVSVAAQSANITLTWEYAAGEEAGIDGFVIQRRVASGIYADLGPLVGKTLRTSTDATVVPGTVYCYQLFAQKTMPAPAQVLRSKPSNEVCGACLSTVLNLRLQ